jgi:gamma-glutamyltranspeptidase/glutathione hydrolase/leukotriene-C4 hydrolase
LGVGIAGFNFTKKDMKENPGLTYHRIIEAFKFAHASLTFLGDPHFVGDTKKVKTIFICFLVILKTNRRND